MVRYRLRALVSAALCAGVLAAVPAPAHATAELTPVIDLPKLSWTKIANYPTAADGVTWADRSSCNPVNYEVCGAPLNESTNPLPSSMRYVRSLYGLVYASNNTNGPHTIQTNLPDGSYGYNRAWLVDYQNCHGMGLVWPTKYTMPSQSSLNSSGWSTVWPRYWSATKNSYVPAPYTDIGYQAWVSPYNYYNMWTNSGVQGWWYGCWRYTTQQYQALNSPPQGTLDSVTVTPGSVSIVGWAFDPNVSGPVNVRVTINGVDRGIFGADVSRLDVSNAINASWSAYGTYTANKGFSETISLAAGSYSVCVSVPDVVPNVSGAVTVSPNGSGEQRLVNSCQSVNVPTSIKPT